MYRCRLIVIRQTTTSRCKPCFLILNIDMLKFSLLFQNCLVSIGVLIDVSMAGSGVKDKEAGDVSRFLNRILGLSVEKQNLVIKTLPLL